LLKKKTPGGGVTPGVVYVGQLTETLLS
jgi:hypothetical protein